MLSIYCFQMPTPSGVAWCPFKIPVPYTRRSFLWLGFAPLSSVLINVDTHLFWAGISVILRPQVDFLSVRKKRAWVCWRFWKQHKVLVFLCTCDIYCQAQVNWRLFLCISLVLAWLFFPSSPPDSVFHYCFWWPELMCYLLMVCVPSLLGLNVEKGTSCHRRGSR